MFWRFKILIFSRRLLLIICLLGGFASQAESVKNRFAKPIIEKDLWRYIVNKSSLSASSHEKLYWHLDWFKKNPDYLTRITKRAEPYLYLITQEVERAGLPLEIALLPIVESAYYPFSYSHGTASGLWQFIPSTAKLYGLKDNWWYDGRRDVLTSTKAAVKYLKNLKKLFKGDWLLAIAAYNSGPGRVQKAVRHNKKQGKPTDFWHLDLPAETKGYVPRLLAVTELIKHPHKYGQTITKVANKPVVSSIELHTQFDLSLISNWSDISLEDLYTLNPGLKRWATPNQGKYTLLLPNKNMRLFKQIMSDNLGVEHFRWVRHQVKRGDSLSVIAKKYTTTTKQIIIVNQLKNHLIKLGDFLIIPIIQKGVGKYSISSEQREKIHLNAEKYGFKTIHRVAEGESLWRIARQYRVSVKDLIKWNNITRPNILKLGKKLVVWRAYSTLDKDLSNVVTLGIDINRKVSYRVKRGDNLSAIAKKFGVRVGQIKQWNDLSNKHLQPGKKLIIMVNVINSKMK
jgi:membrane-bound lytic murein transglycosylase D